MKAARLDKSCKRVCWAMAAAAGVLLLLVLWLAFGLGFLRALVWAAVLGVLLGTVLSNWLCGRMMVPSTSAPRPAAREPAAPAQPAAAQPAAAPAPAATPPSAAAAPAGRPAALAAPEGGKPDDLKKIKGIGPKLETLCHSLGIYHFAQIAGWNAAEVAWMDENLEGFRGRVSRDDWVAQAKLLAAGGETEFSKRVDKGGVY